jgi:MFS transporter, DHA2 family, methylenomycin A resistance protein
MSDLAVTSGPGQAGTKDQSGVRRATLLASSLAFFVILLDTSIVNLALVRMQDALGTDLAGLQWVVDLYALVFASFLLTGGALADKFGAQRLFLLGVGLFTASSALCGLAPGLAWLLTGRALQGVGAALLLPASLTLLRAAYPDAAERARAVGIWIAAGGVANAAGPSVGGALITVLSWRVIFLVNLPIGAFLVWLTARRVLRPEGSHGQRLDWPGQALIVMALGLFTWAIIEQHALGWNSPWILGAVAIALVAAIGFAYVERRAAEPMLPFDLFRGNEAVRISMIAVLHNIGIYGQLFVAGLFLQRILQLSPLSAGLVLLPMTTMIAVCAFISGRWIARSGPYWPLNTGHAAAAAGAAAMAAAAVFPDLAATTLVIFFLTAVGIGAGLASPPMTAALLAALPQQRSGLAGGLLNTSRQIGNVLGIAIFGAAVARLGGVGAPLGYEVSWILAAMALALNVLLGIGVARAQRKPGS